MKHCQLIEMLKNGKPYYPSDFTGYRTFSTDQRIPIEPGISSGKWIQKDKLISLSSYINFLGTMKQQWASFS